MAPACEESLLLRMMEPPIGAGLKMHPLVMRSNAPPISSVCVDQHQQQQSVKEGGGGRKQQASDVVLFVGHNRTAYIISVETLKQASLFRTVLEKRGQEGSIVVECEEALFQNLLCLLRYRSWEALPPMTDAEMFKLRKEVEYYGLPVAVTHAAAKRSSRNTSPSCSPTSSLSSSSSSSPNASPHRNHHRFPSAELPDLPPELADPSKLVLVTRMDDEPRARCHQCAAEAVLGRTCWALSFQYRHAFCTRCGQPPSAAIAPKFLADIFLTAATYYSECIPCKGWSVGSNSTCSLKFLSATPCCPCALHSSPPSAATTWAISTFHSHAFCTQCSQSADATTLVSLLLTLRYGGLHRTPKPGRKEQEVSVESQAHHHASSKSNHPRVTF